MLALSGPLPLNRSDRTFREVHVRTEFGYTAHGIRLPTKVELTIYHYEAIQPFDRKYSRKQLAFEVVQKYKRYQFYDVNVADTIDRDPGTGR